MNSKCQRDRIKSYLWKHRVITQPEATSMGIMRLASRIHELRKLGYKIVTKRIKLGRSFIAEYRLVGKQKIVT